MSLSFYKSNKKLLSVFILKLFLYQRKIEEKLHMYIYTIFNRIIFFKVNCNMVCLYFWVGIQVRRMSGRTVVALYPLIYVC